MKRVIFASGGSGGHLAPAIALAQLCGNEGVDSLILTTEKEVDVRMRERYESIPFIGLQGYAFNGSMSSLFKFVLGLLQSIPIAVKILYEERIDRVVSTGGFGSIPVILASLILGCPVLAHESNSIPGKTTRLFSGLFTELFVTRLYAVNRRSRKQLRLTGFPLRNDLSRLESSEAKSQLGLKQNRKLITILGGSQGAKSLSLLAELASVRWVKAGYQILCVCGPGNYQPDVSQHEHFHCLSFVDDMGLLYGATDLLIARSGAGSIAEIAHFNCPVVLVPLPFSADNHQRWNAECFAEAGAGIIQLQSELHELLENVLKIMGDPSKLQKMKHAQQLWARTNDVTNMVNRIVAEGEVLWV